jgi:HD-like signal output (HDOD) protein
MTDDRTTTLLKRLESGYALPSLSIVATQLIELASDDLCAVDDLARLIERDPSLTVRLLRLANSAFFRSDHQVTTVKQAIMRIGFDRLRIMGLSLSLRDTFPMGRRGPMDYEAFWRSSLYQALLAQSLCIMLGSCDPGEAFVAGLTLEIGLLVFFDLFVKGDNVGTHELSMYPLERQLTWERSRYGTDHRVAGEIALKYWRFPETIVACQRQHERPTLEQGCSPLSLVCVVAREFSSLVHDKGADLTALVRRAESSLGVSPEVISDMVAATLERVDEVAEGLSLEVDRERDMIRLLEKANRALSELSADMATARHSFPTEGLRSLPDLGGDKERTATVAHTLQAVAHEIRNPLVAVGGFARRLASSLDPDSEGGRYVRLIIEETKRLEKALLEMTEGGTP